MQDFLYNTQGLAIFARFPMAGVSPPVPNAGGRKAKRSTAENGHRWPGSRKVRSGAYLSPGSVLPSERRELSCESY